MVDGDAQRETKSDVDSRATSVAAGISQVVDMKEAVKEFCTPVRTSRGGSEEQLAEKGTKIRLSNGVAGFKWGKGPSTLLVHGWCGRGTQLGAYVEPLLAAGRSVIAIDCWGHGDSPGEQSHGVKFAECVELVDKEFGPFDSAVGHSVGAAAVIIALARGMKVNSAVLLAPPSISFIMREFCESKGFDEDGIQAFTRELCAETDVQLSEVDMLEVGPKISTPVLIFHDPLDTAASIIGSEKFAENCDFVTLIKVEKVGHLRIMRSRELIGRALKFIQGDLP